MKRVPCFAATAAAALLLAQSVQAQPGPWKLKGMLGATYNSTSVTDNWSGPEKDAESWGVKLDASAEMDTPDRNWLTILKEEYGRTRTAGSADQVNADLIDVNSVYSLKFSQYVNPYVGFIFTTQNWRFLDPVTYTESIGNGVWIFKRPDHELRTRAGLALRQRYENVKYRSLVAGGPEIPYTSIDKADTPEIEEVVHETGGEWITNYDVAFNQDVKLTSEARVFTQFNGGANLRWDNNLYVRLTKLVTLQLTYLWIYNYDRTPHAVWPQDIEKRLSLTAGFAYNIF